MPHGFRKTGLFGGALVCDLPDNFADVRYVRLAIQQGFPLLSVEAMGLCAGVPRTRD